MKDITALAEELQGDIFARRRLSCVALHHKARTIGADLTAPEKEALKAKLMLIYDTFPYKDTNHLPDTESQEEFAEGACCIERSTRLTEVLRVLSEEENAILTQHTAKSQQAYECILAPGNMGFEEELALRHSLSPAELDFILPLLVQVLNELPHKMERFEVKSEERRKLFTYYLNKTDDFTILSDVKRLSKNKWRL